jgi:hypothetical protein
MLKRLRALDVSVIAQRESIYLSRLAAKPAGDDVELFE